MSPHAGGRLALLLSFLALAATALADALADPPTDVRAADPSAAPARLETIPVDPPPPKPPLERDPPPVTALEAVVVTGENLRREQNRTADSVVVRSGRDLERGTEADVYEVLAETANVTVEPGGYGYGGFSIRGIGSYGAELSTDGALYGTATAIVLDGVALPRFATAASDLSAFDLAQVEVHRGPQGASVRRNSLAGSLIIRTTEPSFTPGLRLRAVGGEDASGQLALAATGPLWSDRLAGSFTVDRRGTRGDIDNATRREADWNGDQSRTLRGRLLLTPGGEDSRYRAILTLLESRRDAGSPYVQSDSVAAAAVPGQAPTVTPTANEASRTATDDYPQTHLTRNRLLGFEQGFALTPRIALSAVTGGFTNTEDIVSDVDYTAADQGYFNRFQHSSGFSQELRATYEGERLRATLGGYYFRGPDFSHNETRIALDALLAVAGVCSGATCAPFAGQNLFINADYDGPTKNLAGFGEAEFALLPSLRLVGGLRLDHEQNARRYTTTYRGDSAIASALLTGLQTAGVLGTDGTVNVGRSFEALLPRAAIVWEAVPQWFLSVTYAEGYRAGGSGYNGVTGASYSFDAETTRNYEAALKASFWQGRGSLAVNGFYTDYRNLQVRDGSGVDQIVDNAGRARIYGEELEIGLRVLRALRIGASAGLLDARFADFDNDRGNFSGNRLPYAPRSSATLMADFRPRIGGFEGAFLRPQLVCKGGSFSAVDNLPRQKLGGYAVLNLKLGVERRRFAVYASATNLLDRQYRVDAFRNFFGNADLAGLGVGRVVGAGVDYRF